MFLAERIPYNQTNAFSSIALDYLSGSENLKTFYASPPTAQGIEEVIQRRKLQPVNRVALVEVLKEQYQNIKTSEAIKKNIDLLLSENTFTVCTAHQPNLFTG